MCPECENLHFSHIFFQHGYLTYYSTYVLENLYVYSLDGREFRCSLLSNMDKLFPKAIIYVFVSLDSQGWREVCLKILI